jgi:hypothetical protein
MDKAELGLVCERVLRSKDADARVLALALQRYLVGEARRARFDKRVYMRRYMAEYRLRGKRRKKR